jgi:hypothetical protein
MPPACALFILALNDEVLRAGLIKYLDVFYLRSEWLRRDIKSMLPNCSSIFRDSCQQYELQQSVW